MTLETGLFQLEQHRHQDKEALEAKIRYPSYGRIYGSFLPSVLSKFFRFPHKVTKLTSPYVGTFVRHSPDACNGEEPRENGHTPGIVSLDPIPLQPDPLTPMGQYLSCLETIPKADDSDSEGTYVSDAKEGHITSLAQTHG